MIRIGLIQFPGSNCERETALAIKRVGMEAEEFLWNEPLDKLRNFDGYIIIGGFSYEDRSRAGIIAALDPVMAEIKTQSETGKPVLGICNGAQILVEAGLVPGFTPNNLAIALSENKRIAAGKLIGTGFYNAWVNIRMASQHQHNAFTRYLSPNEIINLPIAHAEGRFFMPSSLLNTLIDEGMNLFQYCDAEGNIYDHFPINPNGSVGNIAAICNKAGNIMAMMPHPERTANGDPIFQSMRDYIAERTVIPPTSEKAQSSITPLKPMSFNKKEGHYFYLVKSMITDNQALTVQNTLRRLGFPISVERFTHWEIACDSSESLAILKESELLYSPRKEREISLSEFSQQNALSYLVRAKDDLKGQQTLQTFHRFYKAPVKQIRYGVLWQFSAEETNLSDLMDSILLTNIIGNQYAHECYIYEP